MTYTYMMLWGAVRIRIYDRQILGAAAALSVFTTFCYTLLFKSLGLLRQGAKESGDRRR